MQSSNLHYVGAFRCPTDVGADATYATLGTAAAGRALGFNPSNGRLFISGRNDGFWICEMSIPTPVDSLDPDDMNRATLTQSWREVSGLEAIETNDSNPVWIGGLLVSPGGRLVVAAFSQYDATTPYATLSHMYKSNTTLSGGSFNGPYSIASGDATAGMLGGYMADIPSAHQAALGGPCLAGMNTISITSRTSSGPAASVFDPDDLGAGALADLVLGFPIGTSYRNAIDATSSYWNLGSQPHALVFPVGYDSVIFFGSHGTGAVCYGEVPADCTDPTVLDKGYHSYPYRNQAWAFDVNDLIDVHNGGTDPWDVLEQPSGIWNLDALFTLPGSGDHRPGGLAYDAANKRIYWVARAADAFGMPLILVFEHD